MWLRAHSLQAVERAHALTQQERHFQLDQWNNQSEEIEPENDEELIVKTGPLDQLPPNATLFSVISFFIVCLLASMSYWQNSKLGEQLWVSKQSVYLDHEYWRAWTAILVHSDLAHLLSNTPLLFFFGFYLRAFFTSLMFPMMAFGLGGIVNLLTIYQYEPHVRLIGASGMVYAMAAMWLVFYLRFDVRYTFLIRLMRAIAFTLIVMMPTSFVPQVSYLAHSIGYILGALVALFLSYFISPKTTKDIDLQEDLSQ